MRHQREGRTLTCGVQNFLISRLVWTNWRCETFFSRYFGIVVTFWLLNYADKLQADNAIFSGFGHHTKRRVSRLSLSTLRIIRSGPNETNFTIVDIPGLVRGFCPFQYCFSRPNIKIGNESHTEHRTAKSLVEKYLNNPRSIIVYVSLPSPGV
jgi:hypothetical protein